MVVIVFFATFAVETITIRSIHIIYILWQNKTTNEEE